MQVHVYTSKVPQKHIIKSLIYCFHIKGQIKQKCMLIHHTVHIDIFI